MVPNERPNGALIGALMMPDLVLYLLLPPPHFEDKWILFNLTPISYLSNLDWQKFDWFWLILTVMTVQDFEIFAVSNAFKFAGIGIDSHHEHLPHGRDPNVTSCPFSH